MLRAFELVEAYCGRGVRGPIVLFGAEKASPLAQPPSPLVRLPPARSTRARPSSRRRHRGSGTVFCRKIFLTRGAWRSCLCTHRGATVAQLDEAEEVSSHTSGDAQQRETPHVACEYMSRWVPIINEKLTDHLARHGGPGDIVLDPLGHLIRVGGKRFRPILTIATCELVGGDPWTAVDTACAIEFIHTSSLILDDLPCMDDARSRRHVAPVHERWSISTAILTALALFNLAHEILAWRNLGGSLVEVQRHLFVAKAIGANGMIAGQQVDLWLSRQPTMKTPVDLRELRLLKTSALIAAAAVAGAYTGGAPQEQISSIERFGYRLGQAFQKADDNLDAAADTAHVTPRVVLRREAESAIVAFRESFPVRSEARVVIESLTRLAVERAS